MMGYILIVTLLITPLITTHEPPSRALIFQADEVEFPVQEFLHHGSPRT